MGALPSLTGTPAGSLSGGNDYIFAKHDTPAQIEAGIKFINFEDLTPGTGQFNFARQKTDRLPVGFPEPQLFAGATVATKVRPDAHPVRHDQRLVLRAVREGERGRRRASPTDAQAVYRRWTRSCSRC